MFRMNYAISKEESRSVLINSVSSLVIIYYICPSACYGVIVALS